MHSYCTKLFHCKILLCLRKERLHIPTLFVDFVIDTHVISANSGSVQPNTRREFYCFGLTRPGPDEPTHDQPHSMRDGNHYTTDTILY
jgi:hypothetical protein